MIECFKKFNKQIKDWCEIEKDKRKKRSDEKIKKCFNRNLSHHMMIDS